jgi:hypothetical protein
MKKRIEILDKVKYEENPWGKGVSTGVVVKNFLPSPAVLKNAKVRYIEDDGIFLPVAKKDLVNIKSKAKKIGLSPEALLVGVLHDFLNGKLVRAEV